MRKAACYKRVGDDDKYPDYISILEFDNLKALEEYGTNPELAAAVEERKNSWPSGGYERKWRVQYELIKSWGK